MADLSQKDKGEFTIVDSDNNDHEMHVSSIGGGFSHIVDPTTVANKMAVASDGAIYVNASVSSIPPIPIDSTQIITRAFSDVASTAGEDTYYTVTNGKTLTLQLFSAGSEESTGGSAVELFEDPNGDLSVLTQIAIGFVNGQSAQGSLGNTSYVGDGTLRIVLRRRGYSANAREMAGSWVGYEETT